MSKVYVLVKEQGEYSNWSPTIVGVFSSTQKAREGQLGVAWGADGHGVSFGQDHGRHAVNLCYGCRIDWSIEEFEIDDLARAAS